MKPFTYAELDTHKPALDPRRMQQVRCVRVISPDTVVVRSTSTETPEQYEVVLAGVLNPRPADPDKPAPKEVAHWQYGFATLDTYSDPILCGDLWLRIVVARRPSERAEEKTPCVGILYAKAFRGRWLNLNALMRERKFAQKKGVL